MTYKELNAFADEVAAHFGWPRRPFLEIVTHRRGHAYIGQARITVPSWLVDAHPMFQRQYVIHEMCHFRLAPDGGWTVRQHGPEMQDVERATCKAFGMLITYRNEAYLAEVRDAATGELICDGHGQTQDGRYHARRPTKRPHYA